MEAEVSILQVGNLTSNLVPAVDSLNRYRTRGVVSWLMKYYMNTGIVFV